MDYRNHSNLLKLIKDISSLPVVSKNIFIEQSFLEKENKSLFACNKSTIMEDILLLHQVYSLKI